VTEDAFRSQVVRVARQKDWHAMFIGRGRGGNAWVTQMGGDGRGWPDLTLVRERVVFAELKTNTNYHLSAEERKWIEWLRLAGQEVYVWRPRHWEEIEGVLDRRDPDRWDRLLKGAGGDTIQAAAVDRMLGR
jgi:hypothetical protein